MANALCDIRTFLFKIGLGGKRVDGLRNPRHHGNLVQALGDGRLFGIGKGAARGAVKDNLRRTTARRGKVLLQLVNHLL